MSKKKSHSKELDITEVILVLLGVSLLFIFTNPISQNIVNSAMWGLFAIGLVSGVVSAGIQKESRVREFFFQDDYNEVIARLAIGAVLGIGFIFVMGFVLQGLGGFIYNATGSISYVYVASMTEAEVYFVGFVQPILETFVIIIPFIALLSLFRRAGQSWTVSAGLSFVIIVLIFSAFHFGTRGKESYEYSANGFTSFIFNASPNAIQQGTTGFPQLLLGISFMVMAILYRDFLVPLGAHLSNNLFAIWSSGLLASGTQMLVEYALIGLLILVVYSLYKGTFFKYLIKAKEID